MTRVAAFDCGTNTLRVLVADLDPHHGTATDVVRDMRIVRLGQGVDRTGRISEASMQRVFAALDEFVAVVDDSAVEIRRFCATSAARDAENAAEFIRGVRDRVGVHPEVLDGETEARTSYLGATRALPADTRAAEGPLLVLDIGGGSTELILGTTDGVILEQHSLDIGSVRLTERHLPSDPPTEAEIAAAVADIDAALDGCRVDPARAAVVIGVAGTVTTLAAGALGLTAYDSAAIHHARLQTTAITTTVAELLAMSVAERHDLGYLHPGRADVIGAGGLILDRILRRTNLSTLLVSEHDILDGIAWSMVSGQGE